MRKRGRYSARTLGKKSAGKRRGRKRDPRVLLIAFCAIGAGILAATYGLTHQRAPEANANADASAIAAPKIPGDEIAGTAGTDGAINEQAARKEDRLITGSVPKQEAIAPTKVDPKAAPQIAKKKKKPVTTAKTEKSFFDVFKGTESAQPKR